MELLFLLLFLLHSCWLSPFTDLSIPIVLLVKKKKRKLETGDLFICKKLLCLLTNVPNLLTICPKLYLLVLLANF